MEKNTDEPKNTKIDNKVLLLFKTTVDHPDPEFPGTKNKKLLVDYAVVTAIIKPFNKILEIKDEKLRKARLEEFGKKILEEVEGLDKEGLISERTRPMET